MTGARIVVECLKKEKVDTLFCYPGGVVIPIFDELYKHGDGIRLVQPRHEQCGTHAADGYARSTGKVGVVLVTSGPGATNTVTGIATADIDSVPLVIITGQVPTTNIGTDAFQEADITGITLPITKDSYLVKDVEDLALTIKKAFYLAASGRPGPVLVDIPVNISKAETEFKYPESLNMPSYKPKVKGHPKQISKAVDTLSQSEKPLILAGGGVEISGSTELVNEFADKHKIPLVHTLMGHGVCPKNDNLYLGGIGMHGSIYGNWAVQNCDFLLALGTRFSDRILGDRVSFASNAKIVHVDIDPAEIGKNVEIDIPIVGSIKHVMKEFLRSKKTMPDFSAWVSSVASKKAENPLTFEKSGGKIKAQHVIQTARKFFADDTIIVTDVGQNQMWCHQYFTTKKPRSFLSSGGLGTMGYALPSSVGAKIGNPDKEVVVFCGDGGFQMTMQELITIKRENLSIKIVILDNNYLGMVRQWQELLNDKRYSETHLKSNPNFAAIAEVIGIESKTLSDEKDVERVIKELVKSKEAMLGHVLIEPEENVFPMVPAGQSLNKVLTSFEKKVD